MSAPSGPQNTTGNTATNNAAGTAGGTNTNTNTAGAGANTTGPAQPQAGSPTFSGGASAGAPQAPTFNAAAQATTQNTPVAKQRLRTILSRMERGIWTGVAIGAVGVAVGVASLVKMVEVGNQMQALSDQFTAIQNMNRVHVGGRARIHDDNVPVTAHFRTDDSSPAHECRIQLRRDSTFIVEQILGDNVLLGDSSGLREFVTESSSVLTPIPDNEQVTITGIAIPPDCEKLPPPVRAEPPGLRGMMTTPPLTTRPR